MDFDKKEAARQASFVVFAYNMFNAGGLQPPPDPGIAAAGFDLLYHLNGRDFDEPSFYGYLAASHADPGELVLAIRGTQNFSEWLLDFAAIPAPFTPSPDAGFVALGFLSIYDSFSLLNAAGVASTLSDTLKQIAVTHPIKKVTVVGHSLGAALATLAAAELAMLNPAGVKDNLSIYTFGSPRVGLLDFAATFNDAIGTSFRVWNALDLVPEFPTFPYIHVSGFGDSIIQTEQQMSTLIITPACEHHLTSYRWLLDPDTFQLDTDCRRVAEATPFGVRVAGVAEAPTRVVGAQVLRKAACGRL